MNDHDPRLADDRDPPGDGPRGPSLGELVEEINASLAQPPELPSSDATDDEVSAARLHCVLFHQGISRFAAPVENVREVGPLPVHTWVPGAPHWVVGVANIRGQVLSIVDLGEFLALPPSPSNRSRRMLLATSRESGLTAGFVVDGVHGESRPAADELRPATGTADERIRPFLQGVFTAKGEIHALLDLERLMASDAFTDLLRERATRAS